jgi:hypothetical protein
MFHGHIDEHMEAGMMTIYQAITWTMGRNLPSLTLRR